MDTEVAQAQTKEECGEGLREGAQHREGLEGTQGSGVVIAGAQVPSVFPTLMPGRMQAGV